MLYVEASIRIELTRIFVEAEALADEFSEDGRVEGLSEEAATSVW